MRGGAFREDALQAIADNGFATPMDFFKTFATGVARYGYLSGLNTTKTKTLTGKDNITYTYKVWGHRYMGLHAKKDGMNDFVDITGTIYSDA